MVFLGVEDKDRTKMDHGKNVPTVPSVWLDVISVSF